MSLVGWTIVEERLIQSLWERKTVQYIANMLDRPIAEVQRKINEMVADADYKVKLYELPHFKRVIKKKDEEWLKEKKIKVPSSEGLISVRIDSKTVVLAKPGADVAEVRRRHLERKLL